MSGGIWWEDSQRAGWAGRNAWNDQGDWGSAWAEEEDQPRGRAENMRGAAKLLEQLRAQPRDCKPLPSAAKQQQAHSTTAPEHRGRGTPVAKGSGLQLAMPWLRVDGSGRAWNSRWAHCWKT